MRLAGRIPTTLLSALCISITLSALAAEQCHPDHFCATSTATRTATGFNVIGTLRTLSKIDDWYNVRLPGRPQQEVNAPNLNATINFQAPADWDGIWSAQGCAKVVLGRSVCGDWFNIRTDLPKAAPALARPDANFCNWYAAEAVARVEQGAKCGFTGPRWDPNAQAHYHWCLQQQSQEQAWGEHNARAGGLADCARKEAASASPKANQGAGAPEAIVRKDVDIYKQPGGVGRPFDVLRIGTKVGVYQRRADQWCFVAGRGVPGGEGWIWCGKGFELD